MRYYLIVAAPRRPALYALRQWMFDDAMQGEVRKTAGEYSGRVYQDRNGYTHRKSKITQGITLW